MELQNNNSKFFSYLIILIALFFIVFVTKAFFETTQQRWDTKAQLESDLQSAKEDLSDLNALNLKFTNNEDELSKEISKFTIDFDKDDIFSYVHSYVNSVNSGDTTTSDKKREGDTIIIKGINISDGQLGDLGMNEATVSVSASPETICYGASSSLNASATGDPIESYSWSPTTGLNDASVANPLATLNSTTTYTVTVTDENGFTAEDQITITVYDEFTAGEIATPGEAICYGEDPSLIGNTTAANGGDNNIEYKWQSSPDGNSWIDIASSNSETYDPSNLTTTTHFRRLAKDGTCNSFEESAGVWIVTVSPEFNPGEIATTGQTICYDENPDPIGSTTVASGGDGDIEYKWQSSPDGNSWTDIAGTNAATYDPPNLTVTTHYKRLAKDGTCSPFEESTGISFAGTDINIVIIFIFTYKSKTS